MNYFTSNQTGFTVSEYAGIQLREILAGHELLVLMRGKIQEESEAPRWAMVYGARINVQSTRGLKYLGFANLHTPYLVRQMPNAKNHYYQMEFRLPLLPQQLNALEDHRDGGNLDFEVIVACTTGRGDATFEALEWPTWRIPAPQSYWIEQLNSAKARRAVLFEVSMPYFDAPPHKLAMTQHLERAERNLMAGLYTECVAECRKGIEALRKVGQKFDWASLQNREIRESLSKDTRLEALKAVSYLYASPAGHTASEGGVSDYSRADAKLAIAVTATLLSHTD